MEENFTFEDYKLAIQTKYQLSKIEDRSGILLRPTPAQMRELCLMKFDLGLSQSDEHFFSIFFEATNSVALRKHIYECKISKLKPVISFLKGGKVSDSSSKIEIAAILVNQTPRPFVKFSNQEQLEIESFEKNELNENEIIDEKISEVENIIQENKNEESDCQNEKDQREKMDMGSVAPKNINKKHIVLLVGIFALIGGFIMWNFKNEGDCMVWKKDHYEAVSCDIVSNKMSLMTPIVTKKEENIISNFKKIKVCDTTSFFKLGKPCVWYGKSFDGSYDCFTAPGLHPETGKTLKPITEYIVKKHLLKNKEE